MLGGAASSGAGRVSETGCCSSDQRDVAKKLRIFLEDNSVETLDMAGPRASKDPNVYKFVIETLDRIFRF
jgi:Circularly permutated YpsA SLOG family